MFTKFFIGIQKVIKNGITDKPVNFFLAAMAQMLLLDVDDITEHSVFTKNYSAMIHSPFDVIEHAAIPSFFEIPSLLNGAVNSISK